MGGDYFEYTQLTDSVFKSFDVITDFNANPGNDLFLVSTTPTGFLNAGSIATLDAPTIGATLNSTNFAANFVAKFTFRSRSFVAINNSIAGFNSGTDAIIEVTGLTGTLGINNFTTSTLNNGLTMRGLTGNNSIVGSFGDDIIDASTSNGMNTLSGGDGNDLVIGGSGNNTLDGGDGNDFLISGAGNDRLYGGNGNDILIGGLGRNLLVGGLGQDIFVLQPGIVNNSHVIQDFNPAEGDLIGLASGLSFGSLHTSLSGNNTLIFDTNNILLATLLDFNSSLSSSNFMSYTGSIS